MTKYKIDLAFDWNSSPLAGTELAKGAVWPLQQGLVNISNDEQPAWFTQFQPSDTIRLHLFNISELVKPADKCHPTKIQLHLVNPVSGSFSNPFTNSASSGGVREANYLSFSPPYLPAGPPNRKSTVFSWNNGRGFPNWNIGTGGGFELQLVAQPTTVGMSVIATIENPDELDAGGNPTSRRYAFDPEMFVGSQTGGGG